MSPKNKPKRNKEKAYPKSQFIAKLRRLADSMEQGKPFMIQVAGGRIYIPAKALFNVEHEREGKNEEVEFQFNWKR